MLPGHISTGAVIKLNEKFEVNVMAPLSPRESLANVVTSLIQDNINCAPLFKIVPKICAYELKGRLEEYCHLWSLRVNKSK